MRSRHEGHARGKRICNNDVGHVLFTYLVVIADRVVDRSTRVNTVIIRNIIGLGDIERAVTDPFLWDADTCWTSDVARLICPILGAGARIPDLYVVSFTSAGHIDQTRITVNSNTHTAMVPQPPEPVVCQTHVGLYLCCDINLDEDV